MDLTLVRPGTVVALCHRVRAEELKRISEIVCSLGGGDARELQAAASTGDEGLFWRTAESFTGNPAIGLMAGVRLDKRFYGPLYYVASNSASLRAAVTRTSAFLPFLFPLTSIECVDNTVIWRTRWPFAGPSAERVQRQRIAFVAALYHRIACDLVPEFSFTELNLYSGGQNATAWRQQVRQHFSGHIVFSPAETGFLAEVPAALLDQPLRNADPVLGALVDERLLAPAPKQVEQAEVVRAYETCLAQGDDSKAAVAHSLHVSERTLFRRLRDMGLDHRTLQAACRKQRTMDLLQRTSLSIADVARRVGYQDATSLGRAVRKWTGMAPAAFRQVIRALRAA